MVAGAGLGPASSSASMHALSSDMDAPTLTQDWLAPLERSAGLQHTGNQMCAVARDSLQVVQA